MVNMAKILLLAFTLFILISPVSTAPSHAQQNDTSATAELALWNKIKDSGDVSQIKSYLSKFPNGMFYDLAIAKYKNLGGNPVEFAVAKTTAPAKQIAKATVKKQLPKAVLKRVHKPTRYRVQHIRTKVKHVPFHKAHVVTHKLKRLRIVKKAKVAPSFPLGGGGGGSGGGSGWQH